MSTKEFIAILWKRARMIGACALIVGLSALVILRLLTPTYEAEVNLAIVKSTVDINFDPKFKTVSDATTTQAAIDQAARRKALATIAVSADLAPVVAAQLSAKWTDGERTPTELVRAIRARSDGDLIRITARADSSEKAMQLANLWTQAYIKRVNEIYSVTPLSSSEIQAQATAAKHVYDQQEAALVAYKADNPQNQLTRALEARQQALADSLALSNRLQRLLGDAYSLRERLTSNGTNVGVGDELAHLILQANSFSASTNLPASIRTGEANTTATAPLQLQVQLDQLKLDTTTPAQQLSDLNTLIAALEARSQRLASANPKPLEQEVNQLQSQLEQEASKLQQLTQARDLAWSTYTTVSNKVAETKLAEQAQGTLVRVAGASLEPQEPVEPRLVLYTLLAVAVGLVLGIALALWLEYANVKTRDAQRALAGRANE